MCFEAFDVARSLKPHHARTLLLVVEICARTKTMTKVTSIFRSIGKIV